MADAHRYSDNKEVVTVLNKSDLTLGDLRKAVELAEGIDDKADVTFEQVSRSYVRVDEWHADRMWIRGKRADE